MKRLEFSFDCASTNRSYEINHEFLLSYGRKHSNLEAISVLPFCERHGHGIADRHFSKYDLLMKGKQIQSPQQIADAINAQERKVNGINKKEGKPETYINAQVNTLRKKKSSIKEQLIIRGVKVTKGLTWFREGDVIINHIWPDVQDRRVGLKVESKTTRTPRPNTDASRHIASEEYDEDKSMKTIKGTVNTNWQRAIDQAAAQAAVNGNPQPQEA